LDKFPEAFRRYEQKVDVGRLESYRQLTIAFQSWAGEKWKGTARQWEALNREARRLGFEVPRYPYQIGRASWNRSYAHEQYPNVPAWRREVINVKGTSQNRYRDLKTGRFMKKP
jgi:hypothetical protein